MKRVQLSVAIMCIAAAAFTSAGDAASRDNAAEKRTSSANADRLRGESGSLEHRFSIPFRVDPLALSEIRGLESLTVARLSSGRVITITLDYGVPYPTKALFVSVSSDVVVDDTQVTDPLAPPPTLPVRSGYRLISTFKIFGSDSYICAWRNERSDESSLTAWRGRESDRHILLATSSRAILAAAVQPTMHGTPDLSIVVWLTGRSNGDVVAGLYSWNAHKR